MSAKPRDLRSDVIDLNRRLLRMERTLANLRSQADGLSRCARDAQAVCEMLGLKLLSFRLQANELSERSAPPELQGEQPKRDRVLS